MTGDVSRFMQDDRMTERQGVIAANRNPRGRAAP
jgi:hypothetical protein